jgi:hypothetical protein
VLATGLVLPGLVSTPAAEVKLTISPDGGRMLRGTVGWGDGGTGWDIYESVRQGGQCDPAGLYLPTSCRGGPGRMHIYRIPVETALAPPQ